MQRLLLFSIWSCFERFALRLVLVSSSPWSPGERCSCRCVVGPPVHWVLAVPFGERECFPRWEVLQWRVSATRTCSREHRLVSVRRCPCRCVVDPPAHRILAVRFGERRFLSLWNVLQWRVSATRTCSREHRLVSVRRCPCRCVVDPPAHRILAVRFGERRFLSLWNVLQWRTSATRTCSC